MGGILMSEWMNDYGYSPGNEFEFDMPGGDGDVESVWGEVVPAMDACFRCMARSCHCVRLAGGVWVDGLRMSRVVGGDRSHIAPARLPILEHAGNAYHVCPCVFRADAVSTLWDAMTQMLGLEDAVFVRSLERIDALFI